MSQSQPRRVAVIRQDDEAKSGARGRRRDLGDRADGRLAPGRAVVPQVPVLEGEGEAGALLTRPAGGTVP